MFEFKNRDKIALLSFRIGIFLLVSAPFIAAFFLLGSLINNLIKKRGKILKDKWNYLFIIASLLMVIISLIQTLEFHNLSISVFTIDGGESKEKIINWNSNASLIGLFNWIPLFLCFYGFQPYLETSTYRKIAAKIFVAGSVPVLVSGFGQYWFDWYGPFETMNGLIIWFQRPTGSGITSLFNNQNYAGCWLNIVLPFSIAIFFEKTKNFFKRGSSLIFVLAISVASFLTTSRNAWGGLFLTIPLMLGITSFYWTVPILFFIGLLIILKTINYLPESIDSLFEWILPEEFNILNQFLPENYPNKIYSRSNIFIFALEMISKSPLIGLGAATFPIYYYMEHEIYIGHSHNLFIETAFCYGIIVASLIFINIFLLSFLAIKKIYLPRFASKLKDIYFERAWCTSFIVLLFSQLFDVQYFDLRISLSFWILLAGMKCISNENINENNSSISLMPKVINENN